MNDHYCLIILPSVCVNLELCTFVSSKSFHDGVLVGSNADIVNSQSAPPLVATDLLNIALTLFIDNPVNCLSQLLVEG